MPKFAVTPAAQTCAEPKNCDHRCNGCQRRNNCSAPSKVAMLSRIPCNERTFARNSSRWPLYNCTIKLYIILWL